MKRRKKIGLSIAILLLIAIVGAVIPVSAEENATVGGTENLEGYASAKLFTNKGTYTQIPLEIVKITLQSTGSSPIWVKQTEPWKIVNIATGKTVNLGICTPYGYGSCAPRKLMPGERIVKNWDQKDNSGNLVRPGTYITSAKYYKRNPSTGNPTAYIVTTMFTIVNKPKITVNVPNGGENWYRGTTHKIKWTSVGKVGPNVKIELLKGTGISIIKSSTANDGVYNWAIPSGQAIGSNYKIKITSTTNSAYTDKSDSNFRIS